MMTHDTSMKEQKKRGTSTAHDLYSAKSPHSLERKSPRRSVYGPVFMCWVRNVTYKDVRDEKDLSAGIRQYDRGRREAFDGDLPSSLCRRRMS